MSLRGGWRWISTSARASKFLLRGPASKRREQAGAGESHVTRRRPQERPVVGEMMDFDERVPVGPNMYLPSCTYYVSGADFPSLPSFLTQTPSSCPMTYPYPPNLPQVPPGRERAFRDYSIDSSGKWHHRGQLPQCYPAENRVHRDCLPTPGPAGEVFAKSSPSAGYHSGSSTASSFYAGAGRNGVLPQVFDQFFDSAYGHTENPADASSGGKSSDRQAAPVPGPCRQTEVRDRGDATSSPDPEASSGNSEDKPSSTYERAPPRPPGRVRLLVQRC